MGMLQKISQSTSGKIAVVAVLVVAVAFSIYSATKFFGRSDAVALATDRIFVCSETGKSFHVTIGIGTAIPAYSPYSGKNTGYPAELCYWDKDGSIMKEPTAVLLNQAVGKSGPTFCPYCGRLVVGHNPIPQPGSTPPPTRDQYVALWQR